MSVPARRGFLLLSFLFFPILFFFPYLVGQRLLGGAVYEDLYLPWQQFLANQLASGHFPFWNPLFLLGKPVWAEPENALFYPPRWLLFFKPEHTIAFFVAGHIFWAHVGGYRLGRVLGMGRLASWLSGFVYAFGGWMCGQLLANHTFILSTASWIPHVLATLLAFPDGSRKWRMWMILLAAQTVMVTQAGAPQTAYYGGVFVILALPVLRPRLLRNRGFYIGAVAAVASALLVMAPLAINAAISHQISVRAGAYPWERAIWFRLLPGQLRDFVFGPSLHFIGLNNATVFESGVFVGPVVAALAFLALFRRDRAAVGMWAVTFLFLGLAMVFPEVLLRAFRELPGAASFRAPGRFLMNVMLSLAILCGFGWEAAMGWLDGRARTYLIRGVRLAAAGSIVMPLAAHFSQYVPAATERMDGLRAKLADAARKVTGEERPRVMLGEGPLRPMQFLDEGIEMVSGRGSPLISGRYVDYMSGPVKDSYWIEMYRSISPLPHSASSMAAAPVYFTTGLPPAEGLERMGQVPPYIIYRDPSASPRVRFFPVGTSVADRLEARSFLWGGRNPFTELWYEGPPASGLNIRSQGDCTYSLPSADVYEIRCKTTGPGFLWVSQSYYPGWTARVNGVDAPVYPAHLLFQTVPIPSGESSILLRYRPAHFGLSLLLVLIGLGIPFVAVCLPLRFVVQS